VRTEQRTARGPLLVALCIAAAQWGCAADRPLALDVAALDSGQIYTASAGARTLVARRPDDGLTLCAEPAPDAAVSTDEDLAVALTLVDLRDGADQARAGEEESSLGGRYPNVLVTRELFFRLCEFMANTPLTAEERIALFRSTLDSVNTINGAPLGTGSAAQSSLDAEIDDDGMLGIPQSADSDEDDEENEDDDDES